MTSEAVLECAHRRTLSGRRLGSPEESSDQTGKRQLGNVQPGERVGFEAHRLGMRSDTLKLTIEEVTLGVYKQKGGCPLVGLQSTNCTSDCALAKSPAAAANPLVGRHP